VDVDDILALTRGQAIARIGTEVVRIYTPEPLQPPEQNYADWIIANTRRRYCKPVHELKKALNYFDSAPCAREPSIPTITSETQPKEQIFDEFS
jgi:hypothetical protein